MREQQAGIRDLLRLFLILSLEVKAGKLTREDLKLRSELDIGKRKEFEALRHTARKYNWAEINYEYSNSVMIGGLSAEIICDGRIDADALNADLRSSGRFSVRMEEEWQTIWWALQRSPEQVKTAFAKMEERFRSRDYKVPGVMLHVFNNRLTARLLGLLNMSRDEVERQCEAYLGDLVECGDLPGLHPDRGGSFDRSGYGGLGYPRRDVTGEDKLDSEAFWRLHERLIASQKRVFENDLLSQAGAIVDLLEKGQVDTVAARLWQDETGRNGDLRHIPVLSRADPSQLAHAIASTDGEVLWGIGDILSQRHDHRRVELEPEVNVLRAVRTALLPLIEDMQPESPVHAWQLQFFVDYRLSQIVAKYDDGEAQA